MALWVRGLRLRPVRRWPANFVVRIKCQCAFLVTVQPLGVLFTKQSLWDHCGPCLLSMFVKTMGISSGCRGKVAVVDSVADMAASYSIPGVSGDGQDVVEVYEAAGEAVSVPRGWGAHSP
ncbi:MAG: hypothetical protein CM1200mP18_11070 [Gammaproteobacteria bacterium]|nr:MAG: hypothetical protein CM1200mP18_11070 [Gammaproteobacteria bacterium]